MRLRPSVLYQAWFEQDEAEARGVVVTPCTHYMGTSHFAPFGKVCSENVEQVAVGGVIVIVPPCMH